MAAYFVIPELIASKYNTRTSGCGDDADEQLCNGHGMLWPAADQAGLVSGMLPPLQKSIYK